MRLTIASIAAAFVALALVPALHQPLLSFPVLAFFSRACHQDPARSFWIAGVPMAVCARCFGIYAGAVAGALVRMHRQLALRMLSAAAAINLLDVVVESAGLHGNLPIMRVCLGMFLGVTIAALIAAMDVSSQGASADAHPA